MNRWFHPCRHHRRDICLLAGGLLSESEQQTVIAHLATCGDCLRYYKQIQSTTVPLANWEEKFETIQPEPAARSRWTRAIHAAGQPATGRNPKNDHSSPGWWQEVIFPYRRIWAGLAAVWVVILATHVSLQEQPRIHLAKSPASTQLMVTAFKDRQAILAELLADHSLSHEADRPRLFSPKRRSERIQMLDLCENPYKTNVPILRDAESGSLSPRFAESAEQNGERAAVRCLV